MTDIPARPEMQIQSWGDDPAGAFEHLLCHHGARVLVDGSNSELICPPHLRGKRFTLDFELEPVVPIPDLVADREGISATLSFGREPYVTFVPWSAVIMMGPMHAARVEAPPARTNLRVV